ARAGGVAIEQRPASRDVRCRGAGDDDHGDHHVAVDGAGGDVDRQQRGAARVAMRLGSERGGHYALRNSTWTPTSVGAPATEATMMISGSPALNVVFCTVPPSAQVSAEVSDRSAARTLLVGVPTVPFPALTVAPVPPVRQP